MSISHAMIILRDVSKTFTMHLRGAARLAVVENVAFSVAGGECVVLGGPSGTGKSSILKMIYGNYRTDRGEILVRGPEGQVDIASSEPRAVLALRASTLGYVSQFLRTIPRVSALDIVATSAQSKGTSRAHARERAGNLLQRLNVPERLWHLPPATFSGGEQQRVNIACGFAASRPILLLDEPTASLDAANRAVVVDLINERKRAGVAIIGIFHDEDVRQTISDCIVDVAAFAPREVAA